MTPFEAPFVRVLVLYSNTLEDPGVIANAHIGKSQIHFLDAALKRIKKEKYQGALIIADHHPPYTVAPHGWFVSNTTLRRMEQRPSRLAITSPSISRRAKLLTSLLPISAARRSQPRRGRVSRRQVNRNTDLPCAREYLPVSLNGWAGGEPFLPRFPAGTPIHLRHITIA
jgi:hypothetical protein